MRKVILNIHLVLALSAGAFMVLLGITGAVLAFEPELDRLLHRQTASVIPGGRVRSLAEIGAAVSQKYPSEPIVAYLPSKSPEMPALVILSRGIVSVNQYTGKILGVRTRGESFLGVMRALHVRLAMGDVGRVLLKWTSLALLVSLLSGLYLWWPVKRMRIGGAWWSARFCYDLHSSLGFFSLIPVLLLAGTGVVMGFESEFTSLIDKVSNSGTVRQNPFAVASTSPTVAAEITPDQALAIATARVPGALPYRVQMPRYGGFYVVALEYPQNRVTGERNFISIDPVNGRIVSASLSSNLKFRERFFAFNGTIHTGSIWGMPSRIIAALASILLPVQGLSGLLIWLRRKGLLHRR